MYVKTTECTEIKYVPKLIISNIGYKNWAIAFLFAIKEIYSNYLITIINLFSPFYRHIEFCFSVVDQNKLERAKHFKWNVYFSLLTEAFFQPRIGNQKAIKIVL